MKKEKIDSDFKWVLKVLDSCKTENQIVVTENLYRQFLKKWNKYFFENSIEEINTLMEFTRRKHDVMSKFY